MRGRAGGREGGRHLVIRADDEEGDAKGSHAARLPRTSSARAPHKFSESAVRGADLGELLHDRGDLADQLVRRNGLAVCEHVLLRDFPRFGDEHARVGAHPGIHHPNVRVYLGNFPQRRLIHKRR